MELNVKTIIAGIVLFGMGGLSVYLLSNSSDEQTNTDVIPTATAAPDNSLAITETDTASSTSSVESFYAAADARREQHLANKEEEDRLAKLTAIKERSVECKFWKQQQKTTSAAAKIDEKIETHCTIKKSSSSSSSAEEENSSSIASEDAAKNMAE